MSMHEIEDAVEALVRIIAESDEADKRSVYAAVFAFQDEWDCSYTHFRVMEFLIDSRFVYTKPCNAPEGWHDDGYVKEGMIYFEVGSEVWEKAVESGELTGSDAMQALDVDLHALVKKYSSKNPDLLRLWQPLMSILSQN